MRVAALLVCLVYLMLVSVPAGAGAQQAATGALSGRVADTASMTPAAASSEVASMEAIAGLLAIMASKSPSLAMGRRR